MPVYKAPPVIAATSWTGFYAGLGLGFRTSRTDATVGSETGNFASAGEIEQPYDGTALRLSPYVGFNWQFAPRWLAGVEGDFGFASQTTGRGGIPIPFVLIQEPSASLSVKTEWDASLRGRLGYLLTPSMLVYATGGIAWQRYELTSACSCNGIFKLTPKLAANSTNKTGWTVGGGIETALWGHWLARAEYRYAEFGTGLFSVGHTGIFIVDPVAVSDNLDVRLRSHTATFGLAYKFGDPVADGNFGNASGAFASTAAPMAMSWSGFYAGLGLGARAMRDDLRTTALSTAGTATDLSALATSQPFDGAGFRASPYAGYNWQFAPQWIAGLEGDFGFANQTAALPGFVSPVLRTFGERDALALKTTWDASVRGRLGVLLTPSTMAYATGGIAWQHYNVTSTCSSVPCFAFTPALVTFTGGTLSDSATRTGWTVGGGIETALWDRWLTRAEYRYADFGTSSVTLTRSSTDAAVNPVIETFDVKLRSHTVNFGLAYKFN